MADLRCHEPGAAQTGTTDIVARVDSALARLWNIDQERDGQIVLDVICRE